MSLFQSEKIEFPAKYDNACVFYEDHLLMDGEKYPYNELCTIIYNGSSKYMNGVQLDKKISMTLIFLKEGLLPYPFDEENLSGFAKFDYERGLIPTNMRLGRVLEFAYNQIQESTFNQRLELYQNALRKYGKFSFYEGLPEFHNNGDLYDEGKFQGNFLEMAKAGKLINGEKYGGRTNKTSDPFIFGFERGTKLFGLVSDNVTFQNIINRDVLYSLMDNLFKTGKMVNL